MTKAIPSAVKSLYYSGSELHTQTMLEMRKRILLVIPQAEEIVSYGMPAFRVEGNVLAGILANKKHIGYYPFSGSILHLFTQELSQYTTTKSAIHIPLGKPLPKTLISKLIKARISQCPVKQGKVDLSKYEKLDMYWRDLGVAAPARRGLIDSKLYKLADLKKISAAEFMKIHAIGPKSSKIIKAEMRKKKIRFKPN